MKDPGLGKFQKMNLVSLSEPPDPSRNIGKTTSSDAPEGPYDSLTWAVYVVFVYADACTTGENGGPRESFVKRTTQTRMVQDGETGDIVGELKRSLILRHNFHSFA